MDIKYKIYPYPVLADFNDNYLNGMFGVDASLEKDGYDLSVRVNTKLTDDMINGFIREGKAVLVYHLECAQTGFRKVFTTDAFEMIIPIKSADVSGELHFCPFVLANEDIVDYYNPNFHPDYSVAIKKINKGCPLAIGKQKNWTIDKSNSDLLKSSSPFRIMKNLDESCLHMVVEYESEPRIKIKLSANDHALYKNMKGDPRLRDILNSAVVVPALIYVMGQLQKCEIDEMNSNYGSYPWYQAIKETLKKQFGIGMEDLKDQNIFELSQRMLKTPINSAFEKLAILGEDEREEDE